MTRTLFTSALVAAWVVTTIADDHAPPRPRLFVSDYGTVGFKVVPQSFELSTGILFTVGDDGKDLVQWSKKLVNVPDRAFVSPDGKRVVTVDTYANLGYEHSLVVYDDKGKVVVDYKLEDLFTEQEIRDRVPRTSPNRHWASGASFKFVSDSKYFEITVKWGTVVTVELDSGKLSKYGIEEARLALDIRVLSQLLKAFEKLPENPDPRSNAPDLGDALDLRIDTAALAKRVARDRPCRLVWKALIKTGALRDGVSMQEAEKILGPPTDKSDRHVGWYFNPEGLHVAPYLHASITKDGLAEWKIDNR